MRRPHTLTASVIARLQAFLPQMERANDELQQRIAREGAESVRVDAVDESKPYIEMVRGVARRVAVGCVPV